MMLAIVQSSIVLVIAFGALQLLRRQSASIRHLILTIGLVSALIVPFVPSWGLPKLGHDNVVAGFSPRSAQEWEGTRASARDYIVMSIRPEPPISRFTRVAFWIAGTAALALWMLGGIFRIIFLARRSGMLTQKHWVKIAEEARASLNLGRQVRILQTERSILGTWGFLRPRILLPRDASTWPEDRIRAVLTHELAHIKRLDWPVQILAELARAVYWFNPLFWLLCRRLRIESELACDDIVLNAGMEPADYAAHLLELARLLKNSGRAWSPVLAMAHPPSLERRFVAMLNPSLNRKPAGARTLLIALGSALALTIPLAAMRAPVEIKPAPVVSTVLPPATPATVVAIPEPAPAAKRLATKTVQPGRSQPAEAQGRADGSLAGTVTDGTGAVIPGVTVSISSMKQQGPTVLETPIETAVTNAVGKFEFRALPEGSYSLKAALPGFNTAHREWLQVRPSQPVEENISMSVGNISAQVIVTAVGTPKPKPPAGTPQRIRVGGVVTQANLISQVTPFYPQSARDAGIEGTVSLQGVIGTDGTLLGLTPLNNIDRDLTNAALEAVRQWRYKPTLLNGEPVEVVTTIGVQFKLSQ